MTTKDIKNRKSEKITIVDIADMCRVSTKTVSRVINEDKNVSDETREKVLAAMKDSGYQVNMFARALKGNPTGIIMIFTDRHDEEHLSSWHTLMLKYLFQNAKRCGMKVVMAPSNSTECINDDTDGFTLLQSGMADGVILLENVHNDPRAQYFKEHNIPFVIFGEPDDETVYAVSLDNYQVGYKGGAYLVSCKYHDISLLIGEGKFISTQNRIRGFEDAIRGSNQRHKIYKEINSIEKAYQKAREIIKNDKVDAFFVSGDERAIGVYKAIHEAGLRIPEDIAVLGVDNIPIGNYYYPRISTIDQDFKGMAEECISRLVRLIRNEEIKESKLVEFQPSLLEREST